jgi:hypothetical protein
MVIVACGNPFVTELAAAAPLSTPPFQQQAPTALSSEPALLLPAELGPVAKLQPSYQDRATSSIGMKDHRIPIGKPSGSLREGFDDIRKMRDDDCICPWNRRHYHPGFEPSGATTARVRHHALAIITELGESLRLSKARKSYCLKGSVGGAREHIANGYA